MRELKTFWQSLENISGGATLSVTWKRLMGDDPYAIMQDYLRPTGELATWFPHRDPDLLYYRVVTHGPEDHVGVCDETNARVTLATADLVLYAVDQLRLYRAVARVLDVAYDLKEIEHLPHTFQIGHFEPLAGFRFPVMLTIPARSEDLERVIDRFAASYEGPILLLVPTRRWLSLAAEDMLCRRQFCLLPLDETIGRNDDKQLTLTAAGENALADFRRRSVPNPSEKDGMAFFPTPAGACWSQVRIHLLDGHTASITVGNVRGVYNFAQMGMVNRKRGTPSVQWELLRAFASGHGILTWRSPQANRRNQKRRELLARQLRMFFRIDGDPIATHENGWRTVFAIGESG